MHEPKYEDYSLDELYEAADSIDKKKYVTRYNRLISEIKKRESQINYSVPESISKESVPENALPKFYSKQVINSFSILFSIVVGAILFIQNLHEINKGEKYAGWIFLSAFTYLLISIRLTLEFNLFMIPSFFINGIGALFLNYFVWDKLIGDIKYKKRSFWKPLILCSLIIPGLILVMIFVFSLK